MLKRLKKLLAGSKQAVSGHANSNENLEQPAWMREGYQAQQAGELDRALELFTKAAEHNPQDADAWYMISGVYALKGDQPQAIDKMRQAIACNATHAGFHLTLAGLYSEQSRWQEAEAAVLEAIALDVSLAEAHNDLGTLQTRLARPEEALASFQRAIALNPSLPPPHFNAAQAFIKTGRWDEASVEIDCLNNLETEGFNWQYPLASAYFDAGRFVEAETQVRAAIREYPQEAESRLLLAKVLAASDRDQEAVEALDYAAILGADEADILKGKIVCLSKLKRHNEVEACCRQLIALLPDQIDARIHLAESLRLQKRLDEAMAACEQLLELNSKHPGIYLTKALVFSDGGQFHAAIETQLKGLALDENYTEAYINLSSFYLDLHQPEEALAWTRRGFQQGQSVLLYRNLALSLESLGYVEEALEALQHMIKLSPVDARAHFGYGTLLLKLGRMRQGWEEYEWRLRTDDEKFERPSLLANHPAWKGESGKVVLVAHEQGIGDTLQFLRYLRQVVAVSSKVVFFCPKELLSLLAPVESYCRVVSVINEIDAREFDAFVNLMSLPYVFGTTESTIPAEVPYVMPDPVKVASWQRKIAACCHEGDLRVGLAWAGNAQQHNDFNRSSRLEFFAPLAKVAGVAFFSLQKGPPSEQAKTPPEGMGLIDFTEELQDLSDTAALVEGLDLIISVDTSVAHLAGAMARPVWTLLSFKACYRYMLEREDTPWYPTMRLFRQRQKGDWPEVMERVADSLAEYASRDIHP